MGRGRYVGVPVQEKCLRQHGGKVFVDMVKYDFRMGRTRNGSLKTERSLDVLILFTMAD